MTTFRKAVLFITSMVVSLMVVLACWLSISQIPGPLFLGRLLLFLSIFVPLLILPVLRRTVFGNQLDAHRYAKRGCLCLVVLLLVYFSGLLIEPSIRKPLQKRKRIALSEKLKAEHFGKLPRDIDTLKVTSTIPRDPSSKEVYFEYSSPTLYKELDGLIEFSPVGRGGSHGCRGSADIHFYRGNEICGISWNYAHGTFFFPGMLTPASREKLYKWFSEKGFDGFQRWEAYERKGVIR